MTALFVLLGLLAASLLLRVRNKDRAQSHELPEHSRPSPVSEAVQELVTIAGGIYLSLVLLVSFLQIEVADTWLIYGTKIDPLAFIALILAIAQPVAIRLYQLMKGDG